jgi:4-hydroxybenzoate polyprenyltransferase
MKQKFEDFVYDLLHFLMNNKWAFALLFIVICILISVSFLYPINPSLAYGFMGGAVLTTIYKFLKMKENE